MREILARHGGYAKPGFAMTITLRLFLILTLSPWLPSIAQVRTQNPTSDNTQPPLLSGTVIDASGAVIAGATVQVRGANGTVQITKQVGRERFLHHFRTRGRLLSARHIKFRF